MMEDILRDFRNTTKELEIAETELFDMIPLYRVSYAQPAFDHVLGLQQQAKYMESKLAKLNRSEPFAAVTAYQRIKEGFDRASELASQAKRIASEAGREVSGVTISLSVEFIRNKNLAGPRCFGSIFYGRPLKVFH